MQSMPTIKELVANTEVHFTHYHDGNLWYEVRYGGTSEDGRDVGVNTFPFPVPIEDIGNATFKASDKAMLFMRYIRRHLKTLKGFGNG